MVAVAVVEVEVVVVMAVVVVVMAVVVVVMAVAVVVVVMAVAVAVVVMVVLRRHLVRLEQTDAEEQRQGHVPLGGPQDASVVRHASRSRCSTVCNCSSATRSHLFSIRMSPQTYLSPPDLGIEDILVEVFRIDQRDDRVQSRLIRNSLPRKVIATGRGSARPVVSTTM